jgi:hypothetical protein
MPPSALNRIAERITAIATRRTTAITGETAASRDFNILVIMLSFHIYVIANVGPY